MATMTDRLDYVVGAEAAGKLAEAFEIHTVEDLLRHYPRSYVGLGTIRGIADTRPDVGDHITLVDVITSADIREMNKRDPKGRKRQYLVVGLGEGRNKVTATFFNPHGLRWKLTRGTRVMLSGVVGYFNDRLQLTHPAFLVLDGDDDEEAGGPGPAGDAAIPGGAPAKASFGSASLRGIADASRAVSGGVRRADFERSSYPIYPATKDLQSWDIFACVRQVIDLLDPVPDPLPAALLDQQQLLDADTALRAVHLAEDPELRERARRRLAFDEAVGLQWALVARRSRELTEPGPAAPRCPGGLVDQLLDRLPFDLTGGQRDVVAVFATELAGTQPMNRLLQGEVGSGKTIVALLAMLQLVDAGYQCALLAPTEVLADQHARSIRALLGPLAMDGQLGAAAGATAVTLLTGSMSAAAKKRARAEIATGTAGIVIGTHALLVDAVEFHDLGLVVVDEQHRFGVEQRDRLRDKSRPGSTPHLLVMTATPIPRTVALTFYGDLETATLRELPRGRQPIASSVIYVAEKPAWLTRGLDRIREEVAAGRQAYVVAPRIDETDPTDKPDTSGEHTRTSATAVGLYERLGAGALAGLRLGLMHGRLSGEEKEAVMSAFRSGAIDVLVCTTVIEVGVDVPNATVMLIADADWFGVSQLHQLRGRIGRGSHASLCLLTTTSRSDSAAARRLEAVAATLDGFELADLDLHTRGEGDVLGRDQSGFKRQLKLLSLTRHRELIEAAREFSIERFAVEPADPGAVALAARITGDDRADYLDVL